jgi:hypothetical protein
MADLAALAEDFQVRFSQIQLAMNGMDYAAVDREDNEVAENALVEGLFLQGFTAFEDCLEQIFLHYAVGGASLNGYEARSRLTQCTEQQARTIMKADQRYLDWSSGSAVRERANRFFVSGDLFNGALQPRSSAFANMEKIRNRIAHDSMEAISTFKEVERHHFTTERTFRMRPGQLLRARRKARPYMSIAADYLSTMAAVIQELADKAP